MTPYEEMFDWLKHMRFEDSPPLNLTVQRIEDSEGTRFVRVHGRAYLVWDNGGEVGCELLNTQEVRFFPLDCDGIELDSGTLAHRLVCVIKDEPIDYAFRMHFDLKEIA